MIGIYKITNPSGSVYIGQSWDIKNRFCKYRGLHCKGQRYLFNSLSKYGYDNHHFNVIQELPFDATQGDLDKYEIFHWQFYKDCGTKMLNIHEPGKGGKMTEKSKKLISIANTGKKHSKETRITLAEKARGNSNMLGKTHSKDVRKKISDNTRGKRKGIKFNQDHKNKMSAYSRNRTVEHLKKIGLKKSKPVLQFDLEGNFIKEWPSLKSITKGFGFVRGCLNGTQYQAGGSFWEYAHLQSPDIVKKISQVKALSKERELKRRLNISLFYKKSA